MVLWFTGCATQHNYKQAFSEATALQENHYQFAVPVDKTFTAIKTTFVRQGFTIEQADTRTGVLKAVRNFKDSENEEKSYNIIATADINATEEGSLVTLAASQQTILHRTWHEWWHLLWLIPLFPISTEYQTVVTAEGNITEPSFYNDFFAAVRKTLEKRPAAAAVVGPGEQKNLISSTTTGTAVP
jgi:hypothetical protein